MKRNTYTLSRLVILIVSLLLMISLLEVFDSSFLLNVGYKHLIFGVDLAYILSMFLAIFLMTFNLIVIKRNFSSADRVLNIALILMYILLIICINYMAIDYSHFLEAKIALSDTKEIMISDLLKNPKLAVLIVNIKLALLLLLVYMWEKLRTTNKGGKD